MTSEEQALVVKFNLRLDNEGEISYTLSNEPTSSQGTPKDTLEEPKGNE